MTTILGQLMPESYDKPVLKVISRRKWGAQKTKTPRSQRLTHPVQFVRFVETTTDDITYENCSEYMREHQVFRMFHGESDIPFNFVVGSDYQVYEGVGWKVAVDRSRKLKYLSTNCIDIGFIGDLGDGFKLDFGMLDKAIDIIKHGVERNYIEPNFKIIPIDKWRPSYYVHPT